MREGIIVQVHHFMSTGYVLIFVCFFVLKSIFLFSYNPAFLHFIHTNAFVFTQITLPVIYLLCESFRNSTMRVEENSSKTTLTLLCLWGSSVH